MKNKILSLALAGLATTAMVDAKSKMQGFQIRGTVGLPMYSAAFKSNKIEKGVPATGDATIGGFGFARFGGELSLAYMHEVSNGFHIGGGISAGWRYGSFTAGYTDKDAELEVAATDELQLVFDRGGLNVGLNLDMEYVTRQMSFGGGLEFGWAPMSKEVKANFKLHEGTEKKFKEITLTTAKLKNDKGEDISFANDLYFGGNFRFGYYMTQNVQVLAQVNVRYYLWKGQSEKTIGELEYTASGATNPTMPYAAHAAKDAKAKIDGALEITPSIGVRMTF